MPARVVVAVVASMSIAAGLLGPLGPTTYAHAAIKSKGASGTVEEPRAEPTVLTTSLQSETVSGASITVPARTPVSAVSVLEGPHASIARGRISYRVYSDSSCLYEVAWTGAKPVRDGLESRAISLTPGTYYWQATYSGDANDSPSTSACGSTIETVEGDPPVPPCTKASGELRVSTGEGRVAIGEQLSTDTSAPQRLVAWWSGKHHLHLTRLLNAECVTRSKISFFDGVGEARMNGTPGYLVHIRVRVSSDGEEVLHLHVRNHSHELVAAVTATPAAGSEVID